MKVKELINTCDNKWDLEFKDYHPDFMIIFSFMDDNDDETYSILEFIQCKNKNIINRIKELKNKKVIRWYLSSINKRLRILTKNKYEY